MKKTLLSVLFCGFILNGWCGFNEEHKITKEHLDALFEKTEINHEKKIEDFAVKFLTSKIGDETIINLLRQEQFNQKMFKQLCTESLCDRFDLHIDYNRHGIEFLSHNGTSCVQIFPEKNVKKRDFIIRSFTCYGTKEVHFKLQ